jgi:hypothetical protein
VPTFADQIRQDPVILPKLEVLNLDGHDFSPAQTTADQHGQDCPVPHFTKPRSGRRRNEDPTLFGGATCRP